MAGSAKGAGGLAAHPCGMVDLTHHLLEAAARRDPGREALVDGGTRLPYAEADRLSNRLANALRRAGLRRGDRVAVCFPRKCLDEVIALFAISKAGGAFVTVNPLLLPRQVGYILNDCGVTGVIAEPSGPQRLEEALAAAGSVSFVACRGAVAPQGTARMAIDLEAVLRDDDDRPPGDVGISRDLAAVIYTSGSTGGPKGVMLSHANLLASARLGSSYLDNTPDDRILSILPFSFDYGLFQLLSVCLHGATLVLGPFRFPGEIVEALRRERITGMGGVPTLWSLLTQRQSPLHRSSLPDLRYVTNSGAALPRAVLQGLRAALPHTRIYLMYGMTEAFRSTYLDPEEIDRRPGSIGKALPDTEIHLLNERGEPCRPGEIGELVHRGVTVAMGYWGKPEATDHVFRPNPFAPPELRHAEKVCYSGDLARRDEDGFLYLIGRRDAQLKCSGYRVSPTEVEEILYESGRIREAAVVGVPDEVAGHLIRAFVAPRDGDGVRPEDLMDFCGERLPRYMVPRWIDLLDELPKTGSGKIDYPALRRLVDVSGPTTSPHE